MWAVADNMVQWSVRPQPLPNLVRQKKSTPFGVVLTRSLVVCQAAPKKGVK